MKISETILKTGQFEVMKPWYQRRLTNPVADEGIA